MENLLIRADATERIGAGHIMRCIALAQAWRNSGGVVRFLGRCQSAALRRRIHEEGFEFLALKYPHPNREDKRQTLEVLSKGEDDSIATWVVMDGYHFDSAYQEAVCDAAKLMVIDDYNHLASYHADIILNQNMGAEEIEYACSPDTLCLLGSRYVLLRTEFLRNVRQEKPKNKDGINLLVTLGGADPDNVTSTVVQALMDPEFGRLQGTVVLGPASLHSQAIQREIEENRATLGGNGPVMRLVRNGDMPRLMAEADMAISAGGSTCWELAYYGVCTMAIVLAENQRNNATELDKAGIVSCLGWHEELTPGEIKHNLKRLLNDPGRRRNMAEAGMTLLDGKGRLRVLETMQGFSGSDANSFPR